MMPEDKKAISVGDLVKVQYAELKNYDMAMSYDMSWSIPYHGVVIKTQLSETGELCFYIIWCSETASEHIITPNKDKIEVINEAHISNRHG
jgi:hypothetical protein